jgi:hypothetical protein
MSVFGVLPELKLQGERMADEDLHTAAREADEKLAGTSETPPWLCQAIWEDQKRNRSRRIVLLRTA